MFKLILLVFFSCNWTIQNAFSISVIAAPNSSVDRASWNQIEVSPSPFMSVVVYDKFRVPVYKKENANEFYYSPALIIDPGTAKSTFSPTRKRFELNFKVLMWDNLFERAIQAALSDKIGKTIPLSSIRTLPIEEIRLEFTGYSTDCEIDNKWASYASQPSTFTFRLYCIKNASCAETLQFLQHDTEAFLQDFTVHYSLQTQKSTKRQITVKAEHAQYGYMYTTITQTVANENNIVYLQADDAKTLTQEIAMNVLATVVEDEEFISQDQDISITNLLDRVLQMRTVYTDEAFDEQMWSSTFWNDDNARPDVVTHTLNELYNKSETELQDAIKEEVKKRPSLLGSVVGWLGGAVGLIPGVGPLAGAAAGVLSPILVSLVDSSSSLSKPEQQRLKKVIMEASEKSEWNGKKFTPKTLELRRVNLSAFKSSTTIGVVQAKVTRTVSELSSSLNFIDSSGILKERRSQFQTGFIQATYVADVPAGWLPCNGSAVDQELYPELHALTGGVTPNFQGRFPVGRSPHELVGLKGGKAMHQLTIAEMPYHVHQFTAMLDNSQNQKILRYGSHAEYFYMALNRATSTAGVGGNQPHNNLPPYLTVNFIIKT